MPKGPSLTTLERNEIVALRAGGMTTRDIANKIDRSKTVVTNFLKDPAKYGTIKRSGRKRKLTKDQEQEIFAALLRTPQRLKERCDSTGDASDTSLTASPIAKMSAQRIKQEFNLPLSTRRIQQLLSDWRRDTRKALDQQHALSGDGSTTVVQENASADELAPTDENMLAPTLEEAEVGDGVAGSEQDEERDAEEEQDQGAEQHSAATGINVAVV